MSIIYPIIIHAAAEGGYVVEVPDLEIETQGESVPECIAMARDAIGLWCICQQDERRTIPEAACITPAHKEGDIVTLVDVDIDAYRRANDRRIVRRNVSLPSWLDIAAKKAGINVSSVLASALKEELHLADY